MDDYLQRILRARVYDVAIESPLDPAPNLSLRLGNTVLLKREDLQPVFSFKLRGAYNRMVHLSASELERGVIAASAGNHAQGVALAAGKLGCRAVIVMPLTTPEMKVRAVTARGAEVVLHGDTYDEAYLEARRLEASRQLSFIHPFDDPEVIAGQGTVGLEILRQASPPPDAIYVAVGGGGLIAGIAAYVKSVWPKVEIIGVEPVDADAMTRSLAAGKRVCLEQVGLFADGVAVREVGVHTFELAQRYVDAMVTVNTDAICAAIKDVFEDTRSILEPAGALAVAGLKADVQRRGLQGRTLVAVACGANMNFDRLRFVAERAELGEEREAMLAVEIPERTGSLRRLCEQLGQRSLTEFSYRMADPNVAQIFLGVQISGRSDTKQLIEQLRGGGFACLDLSRNELAKLHLRHMVGGRLPQAVAHTPPDNSEELLYRFEFPERPGALMAFVSALHPNWTISIFHYRNQGADVGRIVVGVQVADGERDAWQAFLSGLGYRHWEETGNPAYALFLGATHRPIPVVA
ncbi:threonine ammonia-lyase, biosynthetic [Synechococcus sp. CS-602]|uniref:threonine ammonia-lyase, biosynthetic n=1 Tax=Synechococcaceae TaxID=1890426 RepID=UPI0008FF0831|nr:MULTISPECIES: threonine ammonia-lyase, biosynthetic [Synechococcaceae]MCT4364285.1 threonine ammonia-lyase, biosynthetic [Candidatus Regnicoccus frigidus MAG-AL1]APD48907.1 PLP-dependent threonine dehydratase [Synechococcus sp. SynAce01]MCT0203733.1 threonine ammonia-lyase, biosynthetic [Synechococcus sp. CS-602]MCT0246422.1 threonine ammonia-lyase, biosynthetic [Synechococcus sp. CS-601]MCT4367069.1 threonine ammonia-lyase, biosynthetic [Candidatus Regnicoccus frigidus MAG-AL2]